MFQHPPISNGVLDLLNGEISSGHSSEISSGHPTKYFSYAFEQVNYKQNTFNNRALNKQPTHFRLSTLLIKKTKNKETK